MKKLIFIFLLLSGNLLLFAQQEAFNPNVTIKWVPTGLILGNIALQGEYGFTKRSSLTAKIGIPVNVKHSFEYDGDDAKFNLKAFSFLAGYRLYLSKKQLRGLYLEPYFKYVHHTGEGRGNTTLDNQPVTMNFTNEYNGAGVGAQLGVQFLISKRLVIDLFFLGPEINSATNNFKAVDAGNTLAWTLIQAEDAERDIRDFIDNFPFIRNKTDVMVDRANRTVTANFKGALPGYRIGVSFGVAL